MRRRTLAGATLLLATALAASGGGAAAADRTLEADVGQVVVLRFAGPTLPAYVREALRARRAAGVILFRDNVTSPRQLRALTRDIRRQGGRPLVAVDQEGGDVRILPWAPPARSAPEQVRAASVRADAASAARALRASGVTVSLAPVGDVPSVPGAALAARSFSASPTVTSAALRDAVAGWLAGGVAPTAKHFPGLGAARRNTDDASVTISRTRAQLERVDLRPFRAAVDAGVPLVMVGHARYPALDGRRIASRSRVVIEELLRRELGFDGVVVTDSLEAEASLATGSITGASERALRAGADLVLLTGRGSFGPVYRHLLGVARRSESFRARVREGAARVRELKDSTG